MANEYPRTPPKADVKWELYQLIGRAQQPLHPAPISSASPSREKRNAIQVVFPNIKPNPGAYSLITLSLAPCITPIIRQNGRPSRHPDEEG